MEAFRLQIMNLREARGIRMCKYFPSQREVSTLTKRIAPPPIQAGPLVRYGTIPPADMDPVRQLSLFLVGMSLTCVDAVHTLGRANIFSAPTISVASKKPAPVSY